MRCDFKSRSYFSDVLGHPGLAVVEELGSDGAMLPWFLLVMFLCLPFAIWLSLVSAGLTVSDCVLSVPQACVPVLLYSCSLCVVLCLPGAQIQRLA